METFDSESKGSRNRLFKLSGVLPEGAAFPC